jgi:hypothetical protein
VQDTDPVRSVASVRRPSESIMIFEDWIQEHMPLGLIDDAWMTPTPPTRHWHHGRLNYLFADDHVRLLSVRQTVTPVVMWDNIREWCPDCGCAADYGWSQSDVDAFIQSMPQFAQVGSWGPEMLR